MNTSITLYFNPDEKLRFQAAAKARGLSGAVFARWCVENAAYMDETKAVAVIGSTSGRKAMSIRATPELSASVARSAQTHGLTNAMYLLWLIENAEHIKPSKIELEDHTEVSSVLEDFVGTWSLEDLADKTGRTVDEIIDYAFSGNTLN